MKRVRIKIMNIIKKTALLWLSGYLLIPVDSSAMSESEQERLRTLERSAGSKAKIVRDTIQRHIPGIPAVEESRQGLITECKKPTRLQRQAAMTATVFATPLQEEHNALEECIIGRSRDSSGQIQSDGRAHFNQTTQWPYSAYGVITMRFPHMRSDQPDASGTGCFIAPTVVLTAAHNLYDKRYGGQATSVRFFPAIDEKNAHFGEARVREFYYPKEYTQTKKEDYGILILEAPFGDETGYFGLGLFLQDDIRKFAVSVIGYPGDKITRDDAGNSYQLWGMTGPVKKVDRDYITYDEIDTYKGQSGSPVCCNAGDDYYIVGIHVMGDKEKSENMATLLTKARYQRIDSWVKESSGRRIHDLVHLDVRDLDLSWESLEDGAVKVLTSYSLPLLERLDMQHNKIRHPERLARFKELTFLDLHMNSIGDGAVPALATLPALKKICLSCNKLTYKGAEALQECITLEEIDLHGQMIGGNAVGSKGAIALATLPFLRILNLSCNSVGNAGAVALARSKTIKDLDLSHNSVGSRGAKALARNKFLESLDLTNNSVGDEGAAAFSENSCIVYLGLFRNSIGNKGALSLAQNKTVISLDLGNNYIGDEGALAFLGNTTIEHLELHMNKIGQFGGSALAQNMTLKSLNLEDQFIFIPFKDGKQAMQALATSPNPHLRSMSETTVTRIKGINLEEFMTNLAAHRDATTFKDQ